MRVQVRQAPIARCCRARARARSSAKNAQLSSSKKFVALAAKCQAASKSPHDLVKKRERGREGEKRVHKQTQTNTTNHKPNANTNKHAHTHTFIFFAGVSVDHASSTASGFVASRLFLSFSHSLRHVSALRVVVGKTKEREREIYGASQIAAQTQTELRKHTAQSHDDYPNLTRAVTAIAGAHQRACKRNVDLICKRQTSRPT